jgi:hypothetical protein
MEVEKEVGPIAKQAAGGRPAHLRLVVDNTSAMRTIEVVEFISPTDIVQFERDCKKFTIAFPESMGSQESQATIKWWINIVMEKVFNNFDDHACIQFIPKTDSHPACIELFVQTHILKEILGSCAKRRFHLMEDNTPGKPPIATFNNLKDAILNLVLADIKLTMELQLLANFMGSPIRSL